MSWICWFLISLQSRRPLDFVRLTVNITLTLMAPREDHFKSLIHLLPAQLTFMYL